MSRLDANLEGRDFAAPVSPDAYLQVFAEATVGLAIIDLSCTLVRCNAALRRMLCYSEEELVGKPLQSITHPEDWNRNLQLYEDLFSGRVTDFKLDKRYIRKDGSAVVGRLSVSLVRDKDARPLFAVAVIEDDTTRSRAEKAAQERARKLTLLSRSNRKINSELATPAIMRTLVHCALELVPSEAATYAIARSGRLEFQQYFQGGHWHPIAYSYGPGQGVAGHVMVSREPYVTNRADRDPFLSQDHRERFAIRTLVTVPVLSRAGEVLGCLELNNAVDGSFAPGDIELLEGLAASAAVAFENARLYQKARAEVDARHVSEERMQLAQQTAGMATWDWDLRTNVVYWAEGSSELYGRPLHTFSHIYLWRQALHPDDQRKVWDAVRRSIDSGTPFSTEFRVVWPDGSTHWLLARAKVFYSDRGEPLRMIGINMDMTARKEADAALRASEERFQRAQQAAKIGAFDWDLNAGTVSWWAEVPTLSGITTDGLFESWAKHFHADDRERMLQILQNAIDQRKDFDLEGRVVRPDGEVIFVRTMGHLLLDNGNPSHFVGITMDISERKLAEEALLNSEKLAATGRMAATIAHEINNPLEAVMNLIYLARVTSTEQQVQAFLTTAEQEVGRISHITKQTLGFYRDASAPKQLDLSDLVHETMALYNRKLNKKNMQLVMQLEKDAVVEGFSGELKQVISNLVANAIDASPANSRLLIRTRKRKNGVWLMVADQGSGIRKRNLEKIFEPFFTTKKQLGTGLGLWVTRGIVQKHQGKIRVRSRVTEPSGTIFIVSLPCALKHQQEHPVAAD